MQADLLEQVIISGAIILAATGIAEIQLMKLKSATAAIKQNLNAGIVPHSRLGGVAQNLSFELYSLGGGIAWILLYVALWSISGLQIGRIVYLFAGMYIPIYILWVAISFYRALTVTGSTSNALTQIHYQSLNSEGVTVDE